MKVENWMTKSAPTIKTGSTVKDALKAMDTYGFSEIVVVNEDGEFVGMVKKHDIFDKSADDVINDFLILPELYISPEDHIEEAFLVFMEHNEDFIPVVDDDLKVQGIITLQDILESMIEITAMDEPGTRISVVLPDVPGALRKIVDTLAENRINILSLLTFRESDDKRRVVIRVDSTDSEAVASLLRDYGVEYDEIAKEEGF